MSWLARGLMQFAARVMPPSQRDWIDAMQAEMDHIAGFDRVRWAFGCLVATLKARLFPMATKNYAVSRWVMAVEALGCFGPLAFAWYEITLGASGVIHLSRDIIEKSFMHYPGGPYILAMMTTGVITALAGPLGLALGARYVLTGRGLHSRLLGCALIGLLAAYCVLGAIAGYIAGPANFAVPFDETLMFCILPIAAIAHLMYLEHKTPDATASAAMA